MRFCLKLERNLTTRNAPRCWRFRFATGITVGRPWHRTTTTTLQTGVGMACKYLVLKAESGIFGRPPLRVVQETGHITTPFDPATLKQFR